ncbi:hypothetical protein NXS19_009353 [Fusarium pseudograminearum]|nr:hypothetical protein NXS19_009353 [Fusarium pseudograminearum]
MFISYYSLFVSLNLLRTIDLSIHSIQFVSPSFRSQQSFRDSIIITTLSLQQKNKTNGRPLYAEILALSRVGLGSLSSRSFSTPLFGSFQYVELPLSTQPWLSS